MLARQHVSYENPTIWKCSPGWNFVKTPVLWTRVDTWKRNVLKTMTEKLRFQVSKRCAFKKLHFHRIREAKTAK